MSEDLKLSPCPFCGGNARFRQYETDRGIRSMIECCLCFAEMDSARKLEIIKDWNTRTDPRLEAARELARTVSELGDHCYASHKCAETNENSLVKEEVRRGYKCRYCDLNRALAAFQKADGAK